MRAGSEVMQEVVCGAACKEKVGGGGEGAPGLVPGRGKRRANICMSNTGGKNKSGIYFKKLNLSGTKSDLSVFSLLWNLFGFSFMVKMVRLKVRGYIPKMRPIPNRGIQFKKPVVRDNTAVLFPAVRRIHLTYSKF